MKISFSWIFLPLLTSAIILSFSSCGRKKTAEKQSEPSHETVVTHDFAGDSAYSYVARQVAFGPRVPGTGPHRECALYLENKLKSFGCQVVIQTGKVRRWDGITLNISNIIGSINPDIPDRILLCAHWDSRYTADHDPDDSRRKEAVPGANDAASGVGVLLEIARQLMMKDPGIGVDIVLFDAEDQGQPEDVYPRKEDTWCLGSQYWARNPHKAGYRARFGILLDMVGASGATFLKEEYSMYYAPDVVSKVWNMAYRLGFGSVFPNEMGGGVTDDHYYINEILKIPTIDIIHQDRVGASSFFEHWHTVKDDMSNIEKFSLEAVGKTVLGVIYETGAARKQAV